MNPCPFHRRASGICVALLALGLCLAPAALAQAPLPSWLRAPGAAAHFAPDATAYSSVNSFLAMAHAALTGPTDIGFPDFGDTAAERAAYQARAAAVLGNGLAVYGSGSSARIDSGWGYDAVSFFRSALTDTEGYIASNAEHTIIAFRGSELSDLRSIVQDWAQTDFNVAPVALLQGSLPAGFVHSGFLAAVLSVKQQILQQLRDVHGYRLRFGLVGGRLVQIRPTKPIWTVGYSLGGADATLAAFLLSQQDGMPVRGTITGGAPTVGSAGFGSVYLQSGLLIHRHQDNLEVPPLAFGELARLPGDLTGTIGSVGSWIAGRFDEPLRTPLRSLLPLLLAPANVMADGVSVAGELAADANLLYAHFGSVRYFDRNGALSVDPSANARQNDRIATLSNGVIAVLRQFEPPSPPASVFDVAGWAAYAAQVNALLGRIAAAIADPSDLLAQLGATFDQYVTDHSTVKLVRLLHGRLPATTAALDSMPKRP